MPKRPTDPVMVDLEQFASFDDALTRIAIDKPFHEISWQILQSYESRRGKWCLPWAYFASAVNRGRCLHEAVVREIGATNPAASITLLRQLAETVAMTFYVADHPDYVRTLVTRESEKKPGDRRRKSTQTLINHMDRHYSAQFGVVYADMCESAHFGTSALWSSHSVRDLDDGTLSFGWSSEPHWKRDEDALICCALLLELTAAMTTALIHLGETLIRLVEQNDPLIAEFADDQS